MAKDSESGLGPSGTRQWRPTAASNLDIVGDFAGKGLFGIHGDALLSYCLQNAQVDFHRKPYLHLARFVTSLLTFSQRDFNFCTLYTPSNPCSPS